MSNPYLLLTPGPLSTTATVKEAMQKDWCTWDHEYKAIVEQIRQQLLEVGCTSKEHYTTVFMQGSGTFGVEATLGSVIPSEGKLLILQNGAYGKRIEEIAKVLGIPHLSLEFAANLPVDPQAVERKLIEDTSITHVAMVHCETTTGILNPLEAVVDVIKRNHRIAIIDAMSSFGGIPIAVEELQIDFIISSANKCIQGVPGFSFILCKRDELMKCKGRARSLSLDLYDQWETMEKDSGKWRFTSPTHVVHAFKQALKELAEEGGVEARHARYRINQQIVVEGMTQAGFKAYLESELQSPLITTFLYPTHIPFTFEHFYSYLKLAGYVIYPGKLTDLNVFRIGNMGDVHAKDMERLIEHILRFVGESKDEN
ncbi:2-aminoethylphosphonate--pyruvate transaminase [Paenibacillus sp. FSL H8-0548]|uniref:2-aminoethylphosphonate--pyruvate transaminase n=1 Tax=Paenibacillus sp. FSL H8-0548 TaxID=1920422 RepID=UPI0009F9CFA6|nr:2-aminoethylphosphonate--pyruvate transaminase [Paenibacillus sp. FSL H8-0548]